MNPLAALALPVSALVLAGTTISAVPAVPTAPAALADPADGAAALPKARATVPGAPSVASAPARTTEVPGGKPSLSSLASAVGPPWAALALRGRWGWPLQPQPTVVRAFVPPVTRYGAGHRGVDLRGTSGQDVLAVDAGIVSHVGKVAGRGTVTVLHPSGLRSTYEPVDAAVGLGSTVGRGDVLGRLAQDGSHCGRAACLHLGVIRGDTYLDPMLLLVGGRRVRLLPLVQVPEG